MDVDAPSPSPGRSVGPRAEVAAYAGLALASLGWASAFIAGKLVLAEMTPLAAAAWRYALAAAILVPFGLRARPKGALRGALAPLSVMVVCGGVLYPWLFLAALERTSATNSSLLIALNPVLTVLLVPLIGERLGRRRFAGVLLALGGAAFVITGGSPGHLTEIGRSAGDLLALAAAACWAAFNLASRGAMARLTPAFTNAVVYAAGAAALAALARGEDPWAQLARASPTALAGLLLMALLSSVLAGQLFLIGVRRLGVSRSVVFVYLVPVLTAALAASVLREPFLAAQALGGAAVLLGVFLSTGVPGPPRDPPDRPLRGRAPPAEESQVRTRRRAPWRARAAGAGTG